jgi:PTH1 family peptidyl-tRNA hydrolase
LKVILGLGNPGREYEATRHNVGWWVLDHLADVWRSGRWRRDGDALAVTGLVAGAQGAAAQAADVLQPERDRCCAPSSSARSGRRRPTCSWSCDDVALPSARSVSGPQGARAAATGSSRSSRRSSTRTTRACASAPGRATTREVGDLGDFVLSAFGKVERQEVLDLFPRVVDACEVWLRDGVVAAMNKHNGQAQAKP